MSNTTGLDYEKLVERALLSVLVNALKYVEKDGLPGDHHFYITFQTRHPKVKLPQFLINQHPDNITIVLQYEFNNLKVSNEGFDITLSFNGYPHPISVPFEAVTAFTDPSVKFSLQFNVIDGYQFAEDDSDPNQPTLPYQDDVGKIISLDEFRKKHNDNETQPSPKP